MDGAGKDAGVPVRIWFGGKLRWSKAAILAQDDLLDGAGKVMKSASEAKMAAEKKKTLRTWRRICAYKDETRTQNVLRSAKK